MKFIPESTIERALAYVESADYELLTQDFAEAQPTVLSYLINESSVLTAVERDYVLYLAMVIWEATERSIEGETPVIEADTLGKAEEDNYALLDGIKTKDFRERLNVFFENTPQEDLLAFVEDALVEDEEADIEITETGREPMFVMLKSMIDSF